MKTEKMLNDDILKITMDIQNQYPELLKYLEEMPVTIPTEKNPAITAANLQSYYESLQSILTKYKINQPVREYEYYPDRN